MNTTAQTNVLRDRLLTNIVSLPHMLSARVVGVLALLWGAWSALPEATQQELIAGLNIPTRWLPYLAAAGVLLARVWPQINVPAPAVPPTLTDVVPDTIPIVDLDAVDAEWLEAIQIVYPAMAEAQLERLRRVHLLVRNKPTTQH